MPRPKGTSSTKVSIGDPAKGAGIGGPAKDARQALLMPERDSKGRFPRGNGAGVGGAAKAVRPAFTPANQPSPEEKSAGWDVAKEIRERIAARRHEILEAQFARATDPAHAQGHAAATDLLNRILPPRQEISGAEGGPLEIRRVIVDPKSGD